MAYFHAALLRTGRDFRAARGFWTIRHRTTKAIANQPGVIACFNLMGIWPFYCERSLPWPFHIMRMLKIAWENHRDQHTVPTSTITS